MSAVLGRKFSEETVQFIGKRVSVETSDLKVYSGILSGIDDKLNLILSEVESHGIIKLILNGNFVKEIKLTERPFDLRALFDRLSRVFPGLVKIREDVGAIIVMEKIKVTQKGIEEGSGLVAERVKSVYDDFIKESKK